MTTLKWISLTAMVTALALFLSNAIIEQYYTCRDQYPFSTCMARVLLGDGLGSHDHPAL